VVFSPGTRVADWNRRLRHQALLVEIRHWALNHRVPLQRDMISPHPCVHPGVQPRFPRRLLTRGQTPNLRRGQTQYHGRSLRVLHVVLPGKTEISLLFPDRDPDRDHDSDDAIILVSSLRRSSSGCGSRNHIRRGTIELSHAPGVKRTPSTSPFGIPALPIVPLSTPYPTSPFPGSALPPLQLIPTPFLIEASTPLPRLDLGCN
jgi:hypothetical protein